MGLLLIPLLAMSAWMAQQSAAQSPIEQLPVEQKPEVVESAPASAAEPAWAAELKRRHDELVEKNGPGTDAKLRNALLAMKEEDQAAPERGLSKVVPADRKAFAAAANAHETDSRLTAELKDIFEKSGWPTIALVGIDASNAAMVILTHTRDHAFQRTLLPQLEKLADAGRIDGSALAVMVDKELVSQGLPQRYGTQFKVAEGGLAMIEVEELAGLDSRRAAVFLPPLEAYKQQLSELYHLPATDTIVPAASAKK